VANKDIIVVGASLGGIEALKALVATLPADLKAAVFVVVHISRSSPGVLGSILQRAGRLSASNAEDGAPIKPGHLFVAPPDHHMLLDGEGHVRVTHGPKENLWRPAIDPLFRSAAKAFGPRVIGVILTGNLDDGASGLLTIKQMGGTAVVQHPDDAVAPSMPLNAMLRVAVDYCVPMEYLGALLVELTEETVDDIHRAPHSDRVETEILIASGNAPSTGEVATMGEPSLFACPECHGVLSEIKEETHFRFRCHTGHAYAVDSLLAQLESDTDESVWKAIRSIEERVMLLEKALAELRFKDKACRENYLQQASGLKRRAKALRDMVLVQKPVQNVAPDRLVNK
jgi:two-component system chemotaxis response regulator CheB